MNNYHDWAFERTYELTMKITDCLNLFHKESSLPAKAIAEIALLACAEAFGKALACHEHLLPERADFRQRAKEIVDDCSKVHREMYTEENLK